MTMTVVMTAGVFTLISTRYTKSWERWRIAAEAFAPLISLRKKQSGQMFSPAAGNLHEGGLRAGRHLCVG